MTAPALAIVPAAEVLYGLSFEEYRAIDAVNVSSLKHLAKSAAHYRQALTEQDEDTDAKRLGRCVHTAVLEPREFVKRCACWAGGRRAGKEWDSFATVHANETILKSAEWDLCHAIASAVHQNPHASAVLTGGAAEVSIVWTDTETGIRCKARVDYLANGAIGDLKTTRDGSPQGFGRQAWKLGYHLQAAMYQDAVEAAFGDVRPFSIVAAETSAPHVVQTYLVPDPVLDAGREEYRTLLRALKEYREQDRWPGYYDGVLELALPRWALDSGDDENVDELGLVIGGES